MSNLPVNNSTTSPINMLNHITAIDNYNSNTNNNDNSVSDNITSSLRSQSPFWRNAYPGVVLMSPQSVSKSVSSSFNQSQHSMFFFSKNNNSDTTDTKHKSNKTKNLVSFDDILDKVTYESTNLPSIQHPIPLSSTSNTASHVPCTDISYDITSVGNINNNYNNNSYIQPINSIFPDGTNNKNTHYNTLLSPNIQSPLPQQSTNTDYPLDQIYSSHLDNQYLDVPSLNNGNTIGTPLPLSTNTNKNGFLHDITCMSRWMKNLSVQQQIMAIDNILSVLSVDMLSHTKTKIDSILQSSNVNMSFANSTSPSIISNINPNVTYNNNHNNNSNKISNFLFDDESNPELLKLDSILFSTKQFNVSNNTSRYMHSKNNNHYNNNNGNNSIGANIDNPSYHPWSPQPVPRKPTTFNIERPKSVDPGMLMTKRNVYQQSTSKHSFGSSLSSSNTKNNKSGTANVVNNNNNNNNRNSGSITNNHSAAPTNNSMTSENLCDPSLLKNIPAWLKSLRLHKYSNCLSNLPWYTLIYLTDEELEVKGVSALGARRKLLKAFNIVKDCKEQNLIDKSAY